MWQRFRQWIFYPHHRRIKFVGTAVILTLSLYLTYQGYQVISYLRAPDDPRNQAFMQWVTGNTNERTQLITTQREICSDAPFILPANGFIGLLYADPRSPYSSRHRHQGIDIFSNTEPGVTPVYAAYDGYITREADWKSTLIQRVPDDPLHPGTQIWLYYTHMADKAGNDFIEQTFSPDTYEVFVPQGTLLGYTGNYNGSSAHGIWTHLHFSIVRDDGNGRYMNELEINNTLDPSPYLGTAVNYTCTPPPTSCATIPICTG